MAGVRVIPSAVRLSKRPLRLHRGRYPRPNTSYAQVGLPRRWNTPRAAYTLLWLAFRQSTDRRPVSIARIVQRRAASQNALWCPLVQNRWAEPPVARGLKDRPHQRQATHRRGQSTSWFSADLTAESVEVAASSHGLIMEPSYPYYINNVKYLEVSNLCFLPPMCSNQLHTGSAASHAETD